MRRILTYFVFILSLAACSKKDATTGTIVTKTYDPAYFYFFNAADTPLNIDVYNTRQDYNNNANAELHVRIQPDSEYKWELPKNLDEKTDYYLDWYTDGYTFHNWGVDPVEIHDGFSIKPCPYQISMSRLAPKDGIILSIGWKGAPDYGRRKLFINTTGSQSVWKAVDILKYHNVWQSLTAEEQMHTVTFRKDLTCTYTHNDTNGKARNEENTYILENVDFDTTLAITITPNNTWEVSYRSRYDKPLKDTFILKTYPYDFVMVKQQ